MNKIYIIFFFPILLLFSTNVSGQVLDTTCLPTLQLNEVKSSLRQLLSTDSLNMEIIVDQRNLIQRKNIEIGLLEDKSDNCKQGLNKATINWKESIRKNNELIAKNQKLERRKWWYATGGAFAGLLTALLLIL
jgi:hypothetical protein